MRSAITLKSLDKNLRKFILVFVLTLTFGLITGLIYLYTQTNYSTKGTIENVKGDDIPDEEEFPIPEKYPKSAAELLITTHNHIFGLSLVFFIIGLIFYFNTSVNGVWKLFLMIEPLISLVVTFSSLWGIRFIDSNFVYLTILSAFLMYLSYFIMTGIIIYELVSGK